VDGRGNGVLEGGADLSLFNQNPLNFQLPKTIMKKGRFRINEIFGYKILGIENTSPTRLVGYLDKKFKRFPWYIKEFNRQVQKHFTNNKISILGLGMGVGMISHLNKNYSVEYVEPDKEIIGIAKDYYWLPNNTKIYNKTAEEFLKNPPKKKYDVMFYDIFVENKMHWDELKTEPLNKLKSLLNKNGIIIVNYAGILKNLRKNLQKIDYKVIHKLKTSILKNINQNHILIIKK
jgi:hypothetical protein